MNDTVMIALDTSSTCTGFAIYDKAVYKDSGIFNLKKINNAQIRIEKMSQKIIALLEEYQPGILVVERPPLIKDPQTLITLSEIVGCAKGWAITQNMREHFAVDYIEYGPSLWRSLVKEDEDEAVPRKSKECKIWDIEKATRFLGRPPLDDNEADAVLIGLARVKEFKSLLDDEAC